MSQGTSAVTVTLVTVEGFGSCTATRRAAVPLHEVPKRSVVLNGDYVVPGPGSEVPECSCGFPFPAGDVVGPAGHEPACRIEAYYRGRLQDAKGMA